MACGHCSPAVTTTSKGPGATRAEGRNGIVMRPEGTPGQSGLSFVPSTFLLNQVTSCTAPSLPPLLGTGPRSSHLAAARAGLQDVPSRSSPNPALCSPLQYSRLDGKSGAWAASATPLTPHPSSATIPGVQEGGRMLPAGTNRW